MNWNDTFLKNKKFILILVIIVVFLFVSIYVYKAYVVPKLQNKYVDNKEYANNKNNPSKTADIFLFYTEWCPYCKKAKPEWQQTKEKYEGTKVNNYKLVFNEIDCEANKELSEQFNIEGYPTVYMVADGKKTEMDARLDSNTLERFINSSLQN